MIRLVFLAVLLLSACTDKTVEYVYLNACPEGDDVCQRNLNAQTLSAIGYNDAAIQLLCEDPSYSSILDDECSTSR